MQYNVIILRDISICDKIIEKNITQDRCKWLPRGWGKGLEGRCNQESKKRASVNWSFLFSKFGILSIDSYFVIILYYLHKY